MPTTTVHLPLDLLRALDTVCTRRKTSRNRLVVEACRRLLEDEPGEWPPGFLEMAYLGPRERRELAAAGAELERAVRAGRRNRPRSPR